MQRFAARDRAVFFASEAPWLPTTVNNYGVVWEQ